MWFQGSPSYKNVRCGPGGNFRYIALLFYYFNNLLIA